MDGFQRGAERPEKSKSRGRERDVSAHVAGPPSVSGIEVV